MDEIFEVIKNNKNNLFFFIDSSYQISIFSKGKNGGPDIVHYEDSVYTLYGQICEYLENNVIKISSDFLKKIGIIEETD